MRPPPSSDSEEERDILTCGLLVWPTTSSSSSDSDDDVPLSKLRADARAGIDITVKSEQSTPAPAVKTEPRDTKAHVKSEPNGRAALAQRKGNASVKTETKAAVASDSDDDVPISGLRKKAKVETAATAPVAAARSSRPTPVRTKKRVIKVRTTQRTGWWVNGEEGERCSDAHKVDGHQQIKYKQQECTEELYQTLKGRLTQELLCRWWYAIEWPPAKAKETVRGFLGRRGRWWVFPWMLTVG